MFARTSFSLVALLGILVFIAGCGQKLPADLPKLYPTRVEVTADGQKLERAVVGLHLVGTTEPLSGGMTNAGGIAEIVTRGLYSGAPAGKYKVTVTWTVQLDGPTASQPPPTDPVELESYNDRVMREKRTFGALETQFRDPQTTPFEVEVVEGKNSFQLEVKKLDPPPTWGR